MLLKGKNSEKLIFWKTVEALVLILTSYVKPNETMVINTCKFKRSRLTFDLSRTDDRRRTDAGVTGILLAHP